MSQLPQKLPGFFMYFAKQQKWCFVTLLVCHLAWAIDQTIFPYVFTIFIDRIIGYTGDKSQVWPVLMFPLVLGAGMWILTEVMFRTYDYIAIRTYPKFEAAIRLAMVNYVQGHSHQYFADHFAGNIANKIGDMPESAARIMQLVLTLFIPSIVAYVIGSSFFASMHPLFALILCGWAALHIGICLLFAKTCNAASFIHSESRSTLSGKIVDSLTNMFAVKSFARQRWEFEHINDYQSEEQSNHERVFRLTFIIRVIQGVLCLALSGVLGTWVMIVQWQHDVITAGELVYIFYTSWGLTIMAWICGIELPNLFKEIGTCRQAMQLIQVKHEITDVVNAKEIDVANGEVTFDQVTFHYQKNNNVFDQESVTIEAGSKVGLVGFSGSGKTTFVNLIMRFFDVESGKILIDGQDISQVTRHSLREQISMIPQDPSLFHRTLMDNIRYGKFDATDEEVIAAAKQAHCHEFVMQLDDGYETLVGERGIKLSGGQRQRIAIARAMLKNAPILILDEATSALDSVTEKLIQDSLQQLMADRTTIVVAHRLSTLSEMDRILVFDQGHIQEDGTHEELLKGKGQYAKMWQMQAGGFLPDKESSS